VPHGAARHHRRDEKPAGGEDAANEREHRGRFFRGVPMALRATKVNEDRVGMGRFSQPLRVFFNRAVAEFNTRGPQNSKHPVTAFRTPK
jgi:hypothetical protein